MPEFKPQEVAVLIVNGELYRDWESVMVRHSIGDQHFAWFRFTCSEGIPLVKNFAKLRIKPGDRVSITLAGILVIENGVVYSRQVSYAATTHHIEIQGVSYSHVLSEGSVVHKTGEWKNASFQQIAQAVMQPYGVSLRMLGSMPSNPFRRVHLPMGIPAFPFIEQLGRQRGIVFGSDGKPDLIATTGDFALGSGDAVIEGWNILEAREILTVFGSPEGFLATMSQQTGGDNLSMAAAAHQVFARVAQTGSLSGVANTILTTAEVPGGIPDMRDRNSQEDWKRNLESIQLFITVQGWLKPSGGLWEIMMQVYVRSPMLIMDQSLLCKTVTFTQDSQSGTRTTLELVNKIGSRSSFESGQGGSEGGAEST